jgi:hypothetical protein
MPMPRIVASLRDKINAMSGWALAWLSLVCAVIGGSAASACWVGGLVKGVAGALPFHIGLTVAVILAIAGICDLLADLFPNRSAVYAAIFLPSLFLLVGGSLGHQVHGWSDAINAWSHHNMGALLGQGSATAVATLFITGAVVLSNKVVAKSHGGAAARAGAMAGR